MANITLKVDPAKLKSTVSDFSTQRGKIKGFCDQMMNVVNSLNGCTWSGDAQTVFCNQFRKLQQDMNDIQNKLNEHIADLLEIAANVERTENQNKTQASGLGTDFVQMF